MGWFPGLKPWAESCSPSGARDRSKFCLSLRHSARGFNLGEPDKSRRLDFASRGLRINWELTEEQDHDRKQSSPHEVSP
jgi:hypothetical protein